MLDVLEAPAAPATIRREEYRPPEWLVPEIALEFDLAAVLRVQPHRQARPMRVGRVDDDAAKALGLEELGGRQNGRCRLSHRSSLVDLKVRNFYIILYFLL